MNSQINKQTSKGSLYFKFQYTPLTVSEKYFSESLDLCRLDARLYEVMTEFVRDFWWALEPQILNKELKKKHNGFLIKTIVASIFDYCEIEDAIRDNFSQWATLALRGVKNLAIPELLYQDIKRGGKYEKRVIENTLPSFQRHNLYFSDMPFNKGLPKSVRSRNYWNTRFNIIDFLKLDAALKIKKDSLSLRNIEIEKKYKTNRVFVSRVLNNSYDGIKIDFFEKVIEGI